MPNPHWWQNTRGEWYVVVQAILMLLVLAGPRVDRGAWSEPWSVVSLVGGALLIAGVALGLAGLIALGRSLTPFPHPKEGAVLVENGVYAIVRHPIYAGLSIAAFGWALMWRSPVTLVLATILFVFFDIKARREERWLVQTFARYDEYKRRVKKLVPFLY